MMGQGNGAVHSPADPSMAAATEADTLAGPQGVAGFRRRATR